MYSFLLGLPGTGEQGTQRLSWLVLCKVEKELCYDCRLKDIDMPCDDVVAGGCRSGGSSRGRSPWGMEISPQGASRFSAWSGIAVGPQARFQENELT